MNLVLDRPQILAGERCELGEEAPPTPPTGRAPKERERWTAARTAHLCWVGGHHQALQA